MTETPLVVRGVAFRPSERVTVSAFTLLGLNRIVVRASRAGSFRVRLRLVGPLCGKTLAVRAFGRLGSRATLLLPSKPCIPPPIK